MPQFLSKHQKRVERNQTLSATAGCQESVIDWYINLLWTGIFCGNAESSEIQANLIRFP